MCEATKTKAIRHGFVISSDQCQGPAALYENLVVLPFGAARGVTVYPQIASVMVYGQFLPRDLACRVGVRGDRAQP